MNIKQQQVQALLQNQSKKPVKEQGAAFASSNIALCKYWGKRDILLNLPTASSLSISLNDKGSEAHISLTEDIKDHVSMNGEIMDSKAGYAKKLIDWLDLFRLHTGHYYYISLNVNIPIAAGLASSACIYASMVLAIADLYGWSLPKEILSIFARMGSGSASRSLWDGFVEWQEGERPDGLDSYALPIACDWPELRIGLCMISTKQKKVGSREGMIRTKETSLLYDKWPEQVAQDLPIIKEAIQNKDFETLGKTAESNALTMHATMLSAWPPLLYSTEETVKLMYQVWALRETGVSIYFTQDAGPNLKLLFLARDEAVVKGHFDEVSVIQPFVS